MSVIHKIKKNNMSARQAITSLVLVMLLGVHGYAYAMYRAMPAQTASSPIVPAVKIEETKQAGQDSAQHVEGDKKLSLIDALNDEHQKILDGYSHEDLHAAAQALQLRRALSDRSFAQHVAHNSGYYVKRQEDRHNGHADSSAQGVCLDDAEMAGELEAAYMMDLLAQLAYQEKGRAGRAYHGGQQLSVFHPFLKVAACCIFPVMVIGFTLIGTLMPCPAK